MFKKILVLLLGVSLIGASIVPAFAASEKNLFVTDAKAGQTGKIFVNGPASTDLTIIFVDADGRRMAKVVTTDKDGRVSTDYEAPNKAGEYEAYISGLKSGSKVEFNILPSRTVSTETSEIELSSKRAFADGDDVVEVTVMARDEDGRKIEGLTVQLLSDNELMITPAKQATNTYGEAHFEVRSFKGGSATIYAYDASGDSIASAMLQFVNMESEVQGTETANQYMSYGMYGAYMPYMMYPPYATYPAYQMPQQNTQDLSALSAKLKNLEDVLNQVNVKTQRGGDFLGASLLDVHRVYAEGIAVDHFEFEDIDTENVEIGEPLSFVIRALDANDEVVEDYEGTVAFESDDPDTLLPTDYEFEPADQGEHEFTLALTILNEGKQKITVYDVDNEDIKGEIEITVGSGVVAEEKPVATITLDSPLAGTYSSASQTVSGTTRKDSTVTIFDSAKVIGSVNTNEEGKFSYTATGLSEGKHEFYILSEHIPTGQLTDSEKVIITIDISPPVISKITLSNNGEVEEGDAFTVTIETEDEAEVSIIINGLSYDLTRQARGIYTGQIIAPQEAKDYTISIIASDKFGNEGTYASEAVLKVKPKKKPVTSVLAISEDEAIQLDWDLFKNAARYRISYGKTSSGYTQQIVTIDSTPSWKIRNLEGGTNYYLQVEALNATGQVISLPSQEASAVALAKVQAVTPAATIVTPPPMEQPPSGGQVTQTGPEMYLVLLASLIFLDMYARVRRRLKKTIF